MIYLTKKQLEEIAQQIASIAVKDSDFDEVTSIKDDDFVAIVQEGINKRISLENLFADVTRGEDGKSAYEIWLDEGNTGSKADFLASLQGEQGEQGEQGPAGEGVPTGGSAGQVLAKSSGSDYDTEWVDPSTGTGSVTSVGLTMPSAFSVSGSPVTTSGTLAVSMASGYSIPTNAKQTSWDNKQDALVSGTNIKTINNQSILGSGNITIQGGGGASSLGDLSDVTISTPSTGQELIYDGSGWINGNVGSLNYMKVTSAQYASMQQGGTLLNNILYIIVD